MAWTAALVLVLGIAVYGVAGDSFLTPLAEYTKSHSNPDVPPQRDANTPVEVFYNVSIMNIADVDKEHNTITIEAYVRPKWNSSITWDPADFGGADWITLPKKYFWTPTLQAIGTAVEMRDLSPQKVILMWDGTIAINQLYRMVLSCDVSHIETGSECHSRGNIWGYTKDRVFITGFGGDVSNSMIYLEDSKYEITDFQMEISEIGYRKKLFQIVDTTMNIQEKLQAS